MRKVVVFIAWLLAVAVVLMLSGMVWFASIAKAHGPAEWIQRGGYKNSVGELCCGERDCGYMVGGRITEARNGYDVRAWFLVEPVGAEPFMIRHDGFVPHSEATPSPTGEFWLCRWGGARKCFFAPPGMN